MSEFEDDLYEMTAEDFCKKYSVTHEEYEMMQKKIQEV